MRIGSPFTYVVTIDSPLSRQEAIARVLRALQGSESVRVRHLTASDRDLQFAQKQDPTFLNSFLPDIHVLFSDIPNGSQARIECRVKLFIRIFCIIFLLGSARSLIAALFLLFTGREGSVAYVLISLSLLLSCYGLSYFGLRMGAKRVLSVIHSALS